MKEAEKFDFEPWPHASKFGSWKLSFRREVISASNHPTLVSDRLAGIDVATRIQDLDYSRVVLDVHQMELGTLDLKDSQWNCEDNFSRVQKEDRCIGRDPPQKTNAQRSRAGKQCTRSSRSSTVTRRTIDSTSSCTTTISRH